MTSCHHYIPHLSKQIYTQEKERISSGKVSPRSYWISCLIYFFGEVVDIISVKLYYFVCVYLSDMSIAMYIRIMMQYAYIYNNLHNTDQLN